MVYLALKIYFKLKISLNSNIIQSYLTKNHFIFYFKATTFENFY